MITKEQILNYFRSDQMEELNWYDREEILLSCCSQSDALEMAILQVLTDEAARLKEASK